MKWDHNQNQTLGLQRYEAMTVTVPCPNNSVDLYEQLACRYV